MTEAGKYVYPAIGLDEAIDLLEKIKDQLINNEIKREIFLEKQGLSPEGGRSYAKISALVYYGLAETGEGKIRLTELAKKILYGTENEKKMAKPEAVSKVEVFNEIFKQFGADANTEQIQTFLRQTAGLDYSESQKESPKLRKVYIKVSSYLIPTEKPAKPVIPGEGIGRREHPIMATESLKPEVRMDGDYTIIVLPTVEEADKITADAMALIRKLRKGE